MYQIDMPRASVFQDIFYRSNKPKRHCQSKLINNCKDSLDLIQRLGLQCTLPVHSGCVNTIFWNDSGEYILSGADDQYIAITNPHNQKPIYKYKTSHRANIFSAKFLPRSNDRGIVSCSGDGAVLYTELTASGLSQTVDGEPNLNYFNCHNNGTAYEVMTVPTEPSSFMSCGEDGTVRYYDLRQSSSCHKTCCKENILIFSPSSVCAMALSPISQYYIATGSTDSLIRIYDRRYLSKMDFSTTDSSESKYTIPVKAYTVPSTANRTYRVTSVKYSADESDLLVSYSSDYLYLFDLARDGIELNSKIYSKANTSPSANSSSLSVRKLRLRGDWSDTGPDARPEGDASARVEIGQVRPQVSSTIMHRMTEALSRMLSDPRTRISLMGHASPSLAYPTERQFQNMVDYANEASQPQQPETSQGATQNTNEQVNDDEEGNSDTINKTNNEPVDVIPDSEELSTIEAEAKQLVFDYVRMKFSGHRNARTMIKEATFWGNNYIMSGSDCGHVFVWDRHTGKVVMLLQGDQRVVNCLQPHPTLPYLATSGIDYDVKIWAPICNENNFDESRANDFMERNAVMLEETKDTITVPAAFMIRMLACIHSLRIRRSQEQDQNQTANLEN